MNRRRFITVGGTALVATLAGCTGGTDDNGGDDGGDDAAGDDADDDDNAEGGTDDGQSHSFDGSGQEVTDAFDLDDGFTGFELIHSGASNVRIELVPDAESDLEEVLVNRAGGFDGAIGTDVKGGSYVLDVTADGDWSVDIEQPRGRDTEEIPADLSGTTSDYFGPFDIPGGTEATGSYSGDGTFIAEVIPEDGGLNDLVFNEIDEFDGTTTVGHDGVGWIVVEADGDWSLALE